MSKEGQPFNVGSWSSVTKSGAADLAFDSDDSALSDEYPLASKRKGKAVKTSRAKGSKTKVEPDYEDEYALNSGEEGKQLEKALSNSMNDEGSTVGSSRASSTATRGTARGRGRGRGRATGQALGERSNNSKALRAAVARAAESE